MAISFNVVYLFLMHKLPASFHRRMYNTRDDLDSLAADFPHKKRPS